MSISIIVIVITTDVERFLIDDSLKLVGTTMKWEETNTALLSSNAFVTYMYVHPNQSWHIHAGLDINASPHPQDR